MGGFRDIHPPQSPKNTFSWITHLNFGALFIFNFPPFVGVLPESNEMKRGLYKYLRKGDQMAETLERMKN